jgi:hypothetical protein
MLLVHALRLHGRCVHPLEAALGSMVHDQLVSNWAQMVDPSTLQLILIEVDEEGDEEEGAEADRIVGERPCIPLPSPLLLVGQQVI